MPRVCRQGLVGAVVFVLACLAGGAVQTAAQSPGAGTVVGVVRDEEGRALARAEVFAPGVGRRAVTDGAGGFVLVGLPAGRQLVQVALPGYAPARREVVVGGEEARVSVTLARTPLSIAGVQVTATVGANDPQTVTQAMSQLAGRELEREMGVSLAQTLRAQPGVSVRSMGPAAAMPVMRGLTGDRILVLQDGQRSGDLAGSADDHGVTIDPLSAQRVEMVRGPATLLYGNNALGGVVNVITGDIPGHVPTRAEWTASAHTESAYPGGSAGVKATQPIGARWAVTARGGGRRSEEMRIPLDPVLGNRLANTQMRNLSGALGVGYVGERGSAGGAVRGYDFSYGLPGPVGADPVSLRGRRYEGTARAEVAPGLPWLTSVRADATAQDYAHDELAELTGDVLQSFVLRTRVANLLARHGRAGILGEGAWGVSGLWKGYAATGPAALTPPADSRGVGVFLFEELPVAAGGAAIQLGARFDDYRIESHATEKFGPDRRRSFHALSASVGARVPLLAGASLGGSVARSFRAPTVEELFSNAAHAGTGAVELGNPELRAERGVAVEGVLRVQNRRWNGQLAAYRNQIEDYVYLAAQGDTTVYGVTLPVLSYEQERAVLKGVEGSLEWAAARALVIGALADYVHATQRGGRPLSFMPPARLGATVRWDDGALALGADVHHELRQDRVGAAEELPTPAHTTVRLSAGFRFPFGGLQHSITLRGENLTNELHREATSRIKDFAPGPGRNLALLYRVLY